MSAAVTCESWPALLEACVAKCSNFHSVTVLRETASTQDAAVRLAAQPGHVVTTFRQTAGRGRLGRTWADTGDEGVAVTLVINAAAPDRLTMLSAVAAARAAEQCFASSSSELCVGIRWPNDVVVAERKLAGILIEQDQQSARIGIGFNVGQRAFAGELAFVACSLAQLGIAAERAGVLAQLISQMDAAMGESDKSLQREFQRRDVLRGRTATFEHAGQVTTGRVLDVDPKLGLRVLTTTGERFLPAQTTSLQKIA